MVFGVIVEFGAGLLCIVLGLLVWLKQKVSLVHDYHYRNVRKEDIPAYSRLIGIGVALIGAGVCIAGLLNLLYSSIWWIPMIAGFIAGFIVMNRAQKKYNGSWFS